jgi:hypothetical protein
MEISDLISFIFTVIILSLIYLKKRWEKKRTQHPEDLNEQEKALNDFLKSLEGDMEEMKTHQGEEALAIREAEKKMPPPPPPPSIEREVPKVQKAKRSVSDNFTFKTNLESFKQRSAVEERQLKPKITEELFEPLGEDVVSDSFSINEEDAYKITKKDDESRLRKKLQHLPSFRDLIIFQEVIGKPKALRSDPPYHNFP